MIVVPNNPNSVHVLMIPNGCCQSGFDRTYPVQLNGIIRPDEYQQSIENINKTFKSCKSMWILLGIFGICALIGASLMIAGGLTSSKSKGGSLSILYIIGLSILLLGVFIPMFGMICVPLQQMKKMREAISTESMKYSSRSPIPCSWRLDISTVGGGYGTRQRAAAVYHLIIDIGRQMETFNGQPAYQNNQVVPFGSPMYTAQSRVGLCARCGAARINPTMKFCGSCGQPFA